MYDIILDAGHGGIDPGAVGNGLREKDISLSVTLKVGNILKSIGYNVGYIRTTDKFISIKKNDYNRMKMSNEMGTRAFCSIHCNSAANTNALGLETFSYPGSSEGGKLSKSIHDNVIKLNIYNANRGTKVKNLAVLRDTKAPAALIELAFISNTKDSKLLINEQDKFALGIATGIDQYLGKPSNVIVDNSNYKKAFIEKISAMLPEKTNILNSITIAQACLESAYGTSDKAKGSNNLFGIKAFSDWKGPKKKYPTWEEVNGKVIKTEAFFREYNSYKESLLDHDLFLQKDRYLPVRNAKTYKEQSELLYKCGYATDSHYPAKLQDLIEKYNLAQYDKKIKEEPKMDNIPKDYFLHEINDALEIGILKGGTDGNLRLNDLITREETVVLIMRAIYHMTNTFHNS